ncbi:MAG: hypothetical protein QM710_03670 [Flavobacterium sp.]
MQKKNMLMKPWKWTAAVLFVSTLSLAQQLDKKIYAESIKAYEAKDYQTFLSLNKLLDSLRPFHPTYLYNLAAAHTLNDNREEALLTLRKLVLMNNTIAFEADEDFKSIRDDGGFQAVTDLKKSQAKVIETSKQVVTLSEKGLHPEGLYYLPKSKKWLATSIRKGKIVSFDIKTGECTDWLKEEKMLSVMALKPDANEEYLWVATAAFKELENFDKTTEGKSEVLKVNIKTRKIEARYSVKGSHTFGDLIVAKNGAVYVSDSYAPIIYKVDKNGISIFNKLADGFNLQGLALNKEESKLFVADYLKGIAVIDIAKNAKIWLDFPDGSSAKGIDGLVFYNNSLVAVQNGVKPIRITRFQLNQEQNEITGFKVLDNNRADFIEPALAIISDGKLYFFGNSDWSAYDQNGVLDTTNANNPILFSCKLN